MSAFDGLHVHRAQREPLEPQNDHLVIPQNDHQHAQKELIGIKASATRVKICRRDVAMENHAAEKSHVAAVDQVVVTAAAPLQTVVITTAVVRASNLLQISTSTFTTMATAGLILTEGT